MSVLRFVFDDVSLLVDKIIHDADNSLDRGILTNILTQLKSIPVEFYEPLLKTLCATTYGALSVPRLDTLLGMAAGFPCGQLDLIETEEYPVVVAAFNERYVTRSSSMVSCKMETLCGVLDHYLLSHILYGEYVREGEVMVEPRAREAAVSFALKSYTQMVRSVEEEEKKTKSGKEVLETDQDAVHLITEDGVKGDYVKGDGVKADDDVSNFMKINGELARKLVHLLSVTQFKSANHFYNWATFLLPISTISWALEKNDIRANSFLDPQLRKTNQYLVVALDVRVKEDLVDEIKKMYGC